MTHERTPIEPVDLAIDDAPHVLSPRAQPAFWEDVSGGLHAINPLDDYNDAPFGADALDALSLGHALTADAGLEEKATPRAGHTLIDDCGRRFTIDPDTGIISLADPAVARRERGAVHAVRVRSIDPFGGVYESTFHLRIAEPLPEVVLPDGADPLGLPAIEAAVHPLTLAPPPIAPMKAWCEISAALGAVRAKTGARESAPFGAALEAPLAYPSLDLAYAPLALDGPPPAPAAKNARWFDA
ncbi:MAG: cadherin repeat domain-containing protein [Hyphomonadaceae bacterium]